MVVIGLSRKRGTIRRGAPAPGILRPQQERSFTDGSIHSILSGRISSIRKRVVKSNPRTWWTATGNASHPGFADLSAKLASRANDSEAAVTAGELGSEEGLERSQPTLRTVAFR